MGHGDFERGCDDLADLIFQHVVARNWNKTHN